MSKNSNNQSLSAETSALNANTNNLLNPYQTTLANTAPTLYNTSRVPVTYNGFKWSFNTNVDWGRFLSGEPFVIVPPAGIIVTGVSYQNQTTDGSFEDCPIIKTGWTSEAYQNAGINGVTLWVNGSMKNPSVWFHQNNFNWSFANFGYTLQKWIYDERASLGVDNTKKHKINQNTTLGDHPMSDFLFFPVGLSAGDVLVTAKSNFNGNYTQATFPQGENRWISWTDPYMSRCVIEKYGILTTIAQNSGPTYSDCYRPPVMWNGASLSNRPIFYRHQMAKNTEDYLLKMPEKNIYGDDIDLTLPNIQQELNSWNDFVNNYWISSLMPYNSGYANQYALGAFDAYNSNTTEEKYGYPGKYSKYRDQIFQSVFAPWVTQPNRKKALDKVIQLCIDNWGVINAGGWAWPQGGGYGMCQSTPWLSFLGWIYNRNDIKNWHNNQQLRNKLNSILTASNGKTYAGISTGKWAIGQIQIPEEYYIKALTSQDYAQRIRVYGSDITQLNGFTACIFTNPNIDLHHGLTTPSKAIGATGMGWAYKTTGITAAYSYTLSSVKLNNEIISGSFGVIVADKDVVFRQSSLGPSSGKPGPATLPLFVDSSGNLLRKGYNENADVTEFWGYTPQTLIGSKLLITSGPGAGNTAYTILDSKNTFVNRDSLMAEINPDNPSTQVGNVSVLQYATFILDRDFDNNIAPTNQSTFKIYPAEPNYNNWIFVAGRWYEGHTAQNKDISTIYAQHNYNNIADESHMKHAAIMNWVGNTFEQSMVDYIKDVYWNTAIPSYIRRNKALGSAYLGSIYDPSNILGGNVIVQMFGVTGATFLPRTINTNDLPGASDTIPSIPLDGITLEFIPEFVQSYSVISGSGVTYSGYGKVFDSPKTLLNIKAIIDDKIFISQNQLGLYTLLGDLKVRFGPFLTDKIIIEDTDYEEAYLDRVGVYGFGDKRASNNITSITTRTNYIREIPTLQELANSQSSAVFTFYSDKYSIAGAGGILPKAPGNTANTLVTSYGMKNLRRLQDNKFIAEIDQYAISGALNISDIWYCIASPFISGSSAMADEYKLSNWKKVKNPVGFFAGTNILFDTENVPVSTLPNGNYGTSTDDKLIFFKYMIDNDLSTYSFRDILTPEPTGLTESNYTIFNSTNYAGWTFNDLYKQYKIDLITTNNAPGNAGYFRLNFNNFTGNDYRRKNYNHFRLWFNNYYDFEAKYGFPAFNSKMESTTGIFENVLQYTDRFSLNDTFTENGILYFKSNASSVMYNSIIGSEYGHNGFYNTYIKGRTMSFVVPTTPQTLLWCTGSTL